MSATREIVTVGGLPVQEPTEQTVCPVMAAVVSNTFFSALYYLHIAQNTPLGNPPFSVVECELEQRHAEDNDENM